MSELPAPLVPPEVDLRDFAFMPLDVVRLRDSGLTAKATGDEFRAAVLLWCASWHQVPAASLPDDDDELANICGYSRSRREWAKVRDGAMRGWKACNDGRLYHAAVAGKALEAWIEKLASAIGGATGNAKRWGVQIDTATMRTQFGSAVASLRAIDPQSRTLRKKAVAVLTQPSAPDSPPESHSDSPPDSPPDRKGQGQGQGQGNIDPLVASPADDGVQSEFPDCPHSRILAVYSERLPELPQPRIWEGKRQENLRARWRWVISDLKKKGKPHDADAGVEFFGRMFEYIRKCPLLMGEKGDWSADLGWIVGADNFAKILQGNYERREAA